MILYISYSEAYDKWYGNEVEWNDLILLNGICSFILLFFLAPTVVFWGISMNIVQLMYLVNSNSCTFDIFSYFSMSDSDVGVGDIEFLKY